MNGRLKEYIREKRKILRELHIKLTDEQLAHLKGLDKELYIDNYIHDIIINNEQKDVAPEVIVKDFVAKRLRQCKKLSDNLVYLKDKFRLTLKDIGKSVGVTGSTVKGYTHGINMPSDDKLKKLAKLFKVKPYKDLLMEHEEFKKKY